MAEPNAPETPKDGEGSPKSADAARALETPKPGERLIVAQAGEIEYATGYDAWVNSENAALDVSRLIDESISAAIRRLGAIWTGDGGSKDKSKWGDLVEDTIKDALREAVGFQRPVVGDVYATTSGSLQWKKSPEGVPYGVKKIYHVISVDEYQIMDHGALRLCLKNLFARIDADNKRRLARMTGGVIRSVLIPLIGAGRGGLRDDAVIDDIVDLSLEHFVDKPQSEIRLIGIVARQHEANEKLMGRLGTSERFAQRDCSAAATIR